MNGARPIRIGLTQRVEIIEEYGERRDCLDQRWADLLSEMGYIPVPLCNSVGAKGYVHDLCLGGVILTGGNDIASIPGAKNPAPERDTFERQILQESVDTGMPILGVCRGMQVINLFEGGALSRVTGHIGRRHTVSVPRPQVSLWSEDRFDVNSYHSCGIEKDELAGTLNVLATDESGNVEAFGHTLLPWYGIMWHPEREDPFLDRDKRFIDHVFQVGEK